MRVRPGRSQSGCRASRQHAAEHAFQPGLRQFNAVRCRQCRNAGPESRLPRDHLRRHHHPIDAAVGRMEMLLGWGHRIPRRVGRRQESFHLHRQRLSNNTPYPRMRSQRPGGWAFRSSTPGPLSPIECCFHDDASMSQVKLFFCCTFQVFVISALQKIFRLHFLRCTSFRGRSPTETFSRYWRAGAVPQ